jgi:hypothetical protein
MKTQHIEKLALLVLLLAMFPYLTNAQNRRIEK